MSARMALRRRRRLRADTVQLLALLAGVAFGILLPRIHRGPLLPATPVTDIALALGLGLLGTVALIFSLLILVVQWAATTFTPRLMLFRDAPIVWRTFALTIGLITFSLATALAIGDETTVSVAVPLAQLLLLLALCVMLRALQLQAVAALQLAAVLGSVAERGRAVLARFAAESMGGSTAAAGVTAAAGSGAGAGLPALRSTVGWPHPPAVLQQVDIDRLLTRARAAGSVVVLRQVPGSTLRQGAVLAGVHGGELSGAAVLECLVTGRERTFEQDPTFALRLLADIALRALSPAVNDAATAVQALDDLEDLIARAAGTATGTLVIPDGDGAVRVVLELPGWDELLRSCLDDVIAAAAASPMVLTRIRQLLRHLLTVTGPELHGAIDHRIAWVEHEWSTRFPWLVTDRT
ncbi:DUF2254 domain-containing protein [Kitasatospora sp. NBC_01287]|uniref:DUF2254 family protein n=1 Tax=Kitasatospora sp. NBC_01287 TaxID=2903573 RepID=UPI00225A243A|nr:DUF2254 family protein [Kitasatospora sp. NBC_01287]MCX4745615.1 DUF2254 domain-containing protein [Kitasatospora sp. NBC_01287]